MILCAGCVSDPGGDAPECPAWNPEAIGELDQVVELGLYPHMQMAIGAQEVHCVALEHFNRDSADCELENWEDWAALLLSLECLPN